MKIFSDGPSMVYVNVFVRSFSKIDDIKMVRELVVVVGLNEMVVVVKVMVVVMVGVVVLVVVVVVVTVVVVLVVIMMVKIGNIFFCFRSIASR